MNWREISGDQNLRMAQQMLNQQSEINELKRKLAAVRALIDDNRLGETRLIPATELRAALDA